MKIFGIDITFEMAFMGLCIGYTMVIFALHPSEFTKSVLLIIPWGQYL